MTVVGNSLLLCSAQVTAGVYAAKRIAAVLKKIAQLDEEAAKVSLIYMRNLACVFAKFSAFECNVAIVVLYAVCPCCETYTPVLYLSIRII